MEVRLRKTKGWKIAAIKVFLCLTFAALIITVYVNLFETTVQLDQSAAMTDTMVSKVMGGTRGFTGRPALITALFLKAEGPVRIRRAANSSTMVEMVLTVDSEDLQDMIDEYRQSSVISKPVYPTDTEYILSNPDLCKDSPELDWIVYVHSAVFNYERRQLLRDTWANKKLFKSYKFRVVFLVGKSASKEDQALLKEEFTQYGDIVQGNFDDEYKNLTYKAVMGLKWISTYCPQARYGLKADDDTFMHIFAVAREMMKHKDSNSSIICPLWVENTMPILRERKSCMKWCVKKRDLPGRAYFPQYCAGIGYAISGPLIGSLYEAARTTPFFWIDDVYVTGLLPKKLKQRVDFINLIERFTLKEDQALEQMRTLSQKVEFYFVHTHNRHAFIALWNQLLDRLEVEEKLELSADASQFKIENTL